MPAHASQALVIIHQDSADEANGLKIKSQFPNKIHLFNIFLILLCIAGIYFQVYRHEFLIGWDDQWFVTNHYTEDGLTRHNLLSILKDFYYGQYAPFNQLYYTILYRFFGYRTGYFHLASVLLHLINSSLVYIMVLCFMRDFEGMTRTQNIQVACLTALLFAVHPINVEPVAWVAASKVLLYAFFYIIAVLSYRIYILRSVQSRFWLVLLFFILSFGAKEQAVVFPLTMLLMDYLYGRGWRNRMMWLEKLPVFLISLLMGFVTMESQGADGAGNFYNVLERVPLFFYTVGEYFTKCVIPINVSYLYPFPFESGGEIPGWLWTSTLCIPFALYCLKDFFRYKWVLFGITWFFIHILLVGNLISLARFSVLADRYAYVSSIGIFIILAGMIVSLIKQSNHKNWLYSVSILFLVCLFLYSHSYASVWRNASTLKERLRSTIQSRPDYISNK
ncbi:hypothetical protein H7U22_07700 [Pedobacter sp. CCM 8938]|uniref:Glycosyltransferase RgtA/B/C/D-like domain-containing protein n=1 Tax=Pedobacter fastidiosus TaxID=2765361 RepID=A0ABR7KQF2_9SPHI|nr:hypothetical protein [Pedobacter fastidiosus]MBC6110305.1 hypothetical protein [Pedobacter fastidiosus]